MGLWGLLDGGNPCYTRRMVYKTLALIAFLAAGQNQAQAAKTYRICNGRPYSISVAVGYGVVSQDSTFGAGHEILTRVFGWKNLTSQECYNTVVKHNVPVFYAYARSANDGALYPEKNGKRLCIDYNARFDNDESVEIYPHVTEGCRVAGQWAVPFYRVMGPHFTF